MPRVPYPDLSAAGCGVSFDESCRSIYEAGKQSAAWSDEQQFAFDRSGAGAAATPLLERGDDHCGRSAGISNHLTRQGRSRRLTDTHHGARVSRRTMCGGMGRRKQARKEPEDESGLREHDRSIG